MRLDEFEESHPYLFLVWATEGVRDSTPPADSRRVEFHTVAGLPMRLPTTNTTQTQPLAGPGDDDIVVPAEPLVLPLLKNEDNPFPDRISFGRAPNCDVVIREPSISKLHGHFRDVTPSTATFTDARSANGTLVNGRVIHPGVASALKSRDILLVGRVRLRLATAAELFRWL
jgi:hypothetical protein